MSKKLWISIGAVAAVLGGIYYLSHRSTARGAAARGAGSPPVLVVAGKVRQQDTPIYLNGIGTVFAYNTVTVRSQIDGTLESIAFTEGEEVKAGDLLAQIDSRVQRANLDQAKGKLATDTAQLHNAEKDLARYDELYTKSLIDQQVYNTQQALVAQLRATVHADEAGVEAAQVQFDYTHITAPISGRTGLRQIDQGNVIHSNDANGLVVIAQLQPISVVFTLPQQNWPEIQRLTAAGEKLPVIAYDRDSLKPLDAGELAVVDNQIDATTGTIKLKATFMNEKLILWPGQFVNVRLLVETRTAGVVVPASVIQRGPQGAYAFVISADNTVEVRPVQIVQIEAGLALIETGLKPGESVVVDGQYKLQAGSQVTISPPPGSSPVPDGAGATPRQRKKSS